MGQWSEVAGWAEGESQTLGKWYRAGGARVGVIRVVLGLGCRAGCQHKVWL